MLLLFLLWAAAPGWWLLLCRNEMERGGVVKGSRGYKKAMNLPEEDRVGGGGVTCGPLIPVAGALERSRRGKMSAGVGLGMGNEKEEGRGFRMDLCKRRRLQCERSVVHSGKSLSHAVSLDARSQRNAKERESFVCCCFFFWLRATGWVCLRQAAGDPRGSHSTRPGSEMERMGGRGRSGLP